MANEDTLEIIVSLKNLTEAGFARLDNQIQGVNKHVQESSGHFSKFGSILAGIGMGVGMAAFGAIETGLTKVVGVLEDSQKAYQDMQVSQDRMVQSLKNNVAGFTDATAANSSWLDATNKNLAAGAKLGFTYTEQRQALALLVGVTHDQDDAQNLMNAAMDLARLKGVDLATATDVMMKAEEGNTKGLKAYGVALIPVTAAQDALHASHKKFTAAQLAAAKATDKQATQLKMLAQVEALAKGQADAYADTTAGKLAAAHEQVNEAMVKLGGITDKIVTAAMPALVDAFGNVMDAIGPLLDQIGENMPMYIHMAGEAFDWFSVNILPALGKVFNWFVTDVLPAAMASFNWFATNIFPKIGEAIGWIATNVLPALGEAFSYIGSDVIPLLGTAFDWVRVNVLPPLAAAFKVFADSVLPTLIAAFTWIATNVVPQVRSALQWLADPVVKDLGKAIDWISTNVLPPINAALGWLGTNVVPALGTAFQGLVGVIQTAMGVVMTLIQPVIDLIGTLQGALDKLTGGGVMKTGDFGGKFNNLVPTPTGGGSTFGGGKAIPLASGGFVPARPGGTLARLGEGGENEWVIPASKIGQGGGMGDVHFHFNSTFPPSPQMARDLVDAIEPEMGRRFGRTSSSLGYGFGG